MRFILVLLVWCGVSMAERGGVPAEMESRDFSSTSLPTAYTGSNSQLISGLKGVSNFSVYNGASVAIAVSTVGSTCGSSTTDAFVIPATTGLVIERVAIGRVLCGRSLSGSAVDLGTAYISAW